MLGRVVGSPEGNRVGDVGIVVGATVSFVGTLVGETVGTAVTVIEGSILGALVGLAVGASVGTRVGLRSGTVVGAVDGEKLGAALGDGEGGKTQVDAPSADTFPREQLMQALEANTGEYFPAGQGQHEESGSVTVEFAAVIK
jgi:hypothetical protein